MHIQFKLSMLYHFQPKKVGQDNLQTVQNIINSLRSTKIVCIQLPKGVDHSKQATLDCFFFYNIKI
jgi:hypothetical protein